MPPVVSLSATIAGMTLKSQTRGIPGGFAPQAASESKAANLNQKYR